jgi:uncharacterized protein (DUF2461 family)
VAELPLTVEQRVLAALRGEAPDRVPVFLYLNPYVEGGFTGDPSYAAVLDACRAYEDVIFDWYYPSGFFHTAAELRRTTRTLSNGDHEHTIDTPRGPLTAITRPDWRGAGQVKRWVTTPEDLERLLAIPYVPSRPDLTAFRQAQSEARGRWITQATFEDPICTVGLIDEMALAVWTLEERPLLERMLETAFERISEELAYCLAASVGPLYYFNGPEYALPPLMSPRDFDDFVVRYDTRLIAQVHAKPGNYTIIHSHGRVNHFLERFADIGTDGLNVLEPPPIGDTLLADAKQRIGDRVCLIGNIQYDDLARGSAADVDALVRDAITQGAPGGRFILSPCASPYESPLPAKTARNLIRYLEAGHRHGQYTHTLR